MPLGWMVSQFKVMMAQSLGSQRDIGPKAGKHLGLTSFQNSIT